MQLTEHASVRMQQRNVPPLILQWLADHGARSYDGHGAQICHFDKRAVRRLERAYGREVVRKLQCFLDCYCVLAEDEVVVTAGHRYARVRN